MFSSTEQRSIQMNTAHESNSSDDEAEEDEDPCEDTQTLSNLQLLPQLQRTRRSRRRFPSYHDNVDLVSILQCQGFFQESLNIEIKVCSDHLKCLINDLN